MRPCLEKTHDKKGLEEWLKVKALSSNPSAAKKKKKKKILYFISIFLPLKN
jgi:hypothetical protein